MKAQGADRYADTHSLVCRPPGSEESARPDSGLGRLGHNDHFLMVSYLRLDGALTRPVGNSGSIPGAWPTGPHPMW